MSKICGYSCEHNKSGVCQISGCDKKSIMSDKTEVQMFTRYIDPTITKLEQENKQLKEKLDCDLQWAFKYEKQVDNWNKLKEYIKQEPTLYFYNDKLPFEVIIAKIINKMQELEQGSDSNE